jgi:hypothetical protein
VKQWHMRQRAETEALGVSESRKEAADPFSKSPASDEEGHDPQDGMMRQERRSSYLRAGAGDAVVDG